MFNNKFERKLKIDEDEINLEVWNWNVFLKGTQVIVTNSIDVFYDFS